MWCVRWLITVFCTILLFKKSLSFNCIVSEIKVLLYTFDLCCTANKLDQIRGSFNKFQNWHPYTTIVNHTILTVVLLFKIFSLQFTAVFTLFYNLAGTRSIKFLLAPSWSCLHRFETKCLQMIHYVVRTNEISLGATSWLYSRCCSNSQSIFMRESSYWFQRILAIAILSVCPSVCLSVCHTGGSVKNGAS